MKKPKAEDFKYKGGYGSAEYNDALLCYQNTKDDLLREVAMLQRLLKNKLNIQDRLVATFKKDFEELYDICIYASTVTITSNIIDLSYDLSVIPHIENHPKIKEICSGNIANTTVEDFIQRKAEVEEHTRKAKGILQEILKYMEGK